MFKTVSSFLLLLLLSACVTTETYKSHSAQQVAVVNDHIAASEARIVALISENCQFDQQGVVDQLTDTIIENKPEIPVPMPQEIKQQECPTIENHNVATDMDDRIAGKLLLGEIEHVFLSKEKLGFDARIDTGAVTSSLGVFNLENFERDGDDWVRFTLMADKESEKYEYALERMIRIVQQKSVEPAVRPVIKLQFRLGEKNYNSLFSLADRSHLEYQILIGREFLKDIAAVDVSAKFLLGGK